MSSESTRQYLREMMDFLRDKMRSPDIGGEVIVRRYEIDEIADNVGMDRQEAWRGFVKLKGAAWQGRLLEESRSEERGYTAARLTWVSPDPRG
jgi:hypothetical protein